MVQCKPLLLLFLVFFSHHPLFCWYFNINIYEKGCAVAQIKRYKCRQKKNKHEAQELRSFREWCCDEEGVLVLVLE